MEKKLFLCFALIFIIFLDYGLSIRWLSLQHSNLHWNFSSLINNNPSSRGIRSGIRSPCGIARKRYGLAKVQAKLCRKFTEVMPHVQKAAILASETCRIMFANRRWNCSSIITAPYLSPDLTRATREQAYVYAISSAALTYTMARACSSGSLHHCTCASKPTDQPNGNFQWGGCGDNLKWGAHFAKKFIDTLEKQMLNKSKSNHHKLDTRMDSKDNGNELKMKMLKRQIALINLHNNKVGRKVIAESIHTKCKCHGVSGSCSIRTCWKAMPHITETGQKLLQRYTKALEVSKNYQDYISNPKFFEKRYPYTDQLIYYSKSPDYCTRDERLGSYGTIGRKCNVTSSGPESCRQLCCGRGYRTVVEEKIERCQCKYYYCCYVKCKICRTMTQNYECS